MKLNTEELVVLSFETDSLASASPVDPFDPTAQTNCDDCLSPTIQGCW